MNISSLSVGDLDKVVKVANLLKADPAANDVKLAKAAGFKKQPALGELKKRVAEFLGTEGFKRDFIFKGKVLWPDIQAKEEDSAKRAFPDGVSKVAGMSQAGLNLAEIADLFFHLCEIAARADKPIGEVLPFEYDRFRDLVVRKSDEIRKDRHYFDPRYADPDYREPARPWQYPMHTVDALNWSWPDPIPEAWHQTVRAQEVAAGEELKQSKRNAEPEPTEDDVNCGLVDKLPVIVTKSPETSGYSGT